MILLIIWLSFAIVVACDASDRGMSAVGWFLLMLLCPIFILLYLVVRKPLIKKKSE